MLSWKACLLRLLKPLLTREPGLLWLKALLTREACLLRLLEPWTLAWKAGGLRLELLLLLGIKPRLHGILITLSLSPLRHLGWSWLPAVVVVVEGRVDCLLISAHYAVLWPPKRRRRSLFAQDIILDQSALSRSSWTNANHVTYIMQQERKR